MFLLQKICIPILTYAMEVLTISPNVIKKLDNVTNKVIRRVFDICDFENIMFVRKNVELISLDIVRKKRRVQYLTNLRNKDLAFGDIIFRSLILTTYGCLILFAVKAQLVQPRNF